VPQSRRCDPRESERTKARPVATPGPRSLQISRHYLRRHQPLSARDPRPTRGSWSKRACPATRVHPSPAPAPQHPARHRIVRQPMAIPCSRAKSQRAEARTRASTAFWLFRAASFCLPPRGMRGTLSLVSISCDESMAKSRQDGRLPPYALLTTDGTNMELAARNEFLASCSMGQLTQSDAILSWLRQREDEMAA